MSHPPASLAIYLLGPARLERNGQPVEVETRKASALLAYLALHPERLSRDQLAAFFWPEYDQERAYANLRRTLWALNKALGDGWLTADNLTLELRPQAGVWVDVLEFQRLLAQCRTHGHRNDEVCPACLEPLGEAVTLVRGDFLEGFSLRDSAAFDDWHFFEAESLRKEVAASLEKLVRGHSAQQEDETAIDYARRWLALDPLHEPVHCWLMQLYAWTGQPAAATRQYQECVRVLKAELDAPPEAETTALYNRIRTKQIGTRPAKPPPASLTLPQPPPAPPVPASTTPPVHGLPPAIAAAAEDELRMVTVLCAALTEPLPLAQTYPSAQSVQRMKRIFQVAEAILLRYEGRVERFLGEGVVALFGTQQLHEDDPERAVRATLELRQAAQTAGLQMSAGLTTGHVYLSPHGSSMTTIGPVVNLALRLQSKADADQLLVSEATYRQTRGVAVYTPLPLTLQSSAAPLQVYQIEQLQLHPQKARGIAGLHAPLVGRTKELAALQDALAAVHNGEGQLVTLIGDAGVGKSRLVSELRQTDKENDPLRSAVPGAPSGPPCLWLEGRCLEMSISASYWPFLDMLRVYLAWQPEEAETNRAGRIVTALDALVTRGTLTAEQREEMGPLLGNLLAVRFGNDWDERLKFAGPEQIRHQTLMTLRDFFVALAQQQPLVLVLEDLHWADSLSLDLVTLLMAVLAEHPLLLLCVYRPEQQHRCWQLAALAAAKCPDHFTEVRLRELTTKQSQQLVEGLLTIENLTPKVKATILQKAQGNPLFVEEVIRSLIDAGIVYRQDEVWRAKEEIENVVVPETVQSVILSRVDRLGEALKGILQRAAVIGRVFGRRLLVQLAPPGLDLDNAISALTNHALIYQERVVPEEEYSFKHVLVQEAIYQTTLAERREGFHRQVGEAMEQLYADNLAECYEQLAYHYDRSGVVEKAIEYLLKAGEKARLAYLNEEAIGYFRRSLEQLDQVSPTNTVRLGRALQIWRFEAWKALGQIDYHADINDKAELYLRQAIDLGRQIGMPAQTLVRLYFWLGEVLWWQGRYAERIRIGEEGMTLIGDECESIEAVLMNATVGFGYYALGNLDKACELTLRNTEFIRGLPYVEELGAPYIHIVIAYVHFEKNLEEAKKWVHLILRQAEQHHDLQTLADIHQHNASIILWSCGDLRGATISFQLALALFVKIGNRKHECEVLSLLAGCFLSLGDLRQAEECARKALVMAESKQFHLWVEINMRRTLSVIVLCRGDWAQAAEIYQNYIQTSRATHDVVGETWGAHLLAQVYLAQGNRQEALRYTEFIADRFNQPEMKPSFRYSAYDLVVILSVFEEVWQDNERFRIYCQQLRAEDPELANNSCRQWFLEPTQADFGFGILDGSSTSFGLQGGEFQNLEFSSKTSVMESSKIENGEWLWQDPFSDCAYKVRNGLEIHAVNGRELFYINLSAPRLLRSIEGDFAAQTVCTPASSTQPAIGGLLLWKDEQNYLCLDKGCLGEHQIRFWGYLANDNMIIGRGLLPATRAFLRLERRGAHVRALCSVDGKEWFTTGHIEFPVADPVQVGMHAIGNIDRLIYPGAYPDGTAIRFESFTLYKQAEEIE